MRLTALTYKNFFLFPAIILLFFVCLATNDSSHQPYESVLKSSFESSAFISYKGKVKHKQTLETIFRNANVRQHDRPLILKSFAKIYNPKLIRPGQSYIFWSDSSGFTDRFQFYMRPDLVINVARDTSGNFKAAKQPIEIITHIKMLYGKIKTNLYEAILESGQNPELVFAYTDIFQWDIDFFTDPREGDEFKIIYESQYLIDPTSDDSTANFIKYGRILGAQYNQKDTEFTAVYFNNSPADSGYYTLNGEAIQKTFLKSPLNYRKISSYFSGSRRHPITKKIRAHYAVDYAAPTGTPVVAPADGIIIATGRNRGLGNFIKIKHKNGRFLTLYGHLNRFAKGIKKGNPVKQRQIIGYVGATGLATGPHLHYAVYDHGHPVNPLKMRNIPYDPILPENWKKFEQFKIAIEWQLQMINPQERFYFLTDSYSELYGKHLPRH